MSDGAALAGAAVRTALAAVPGGASVVLAVSGGADSAGMAHLVVAARPDLDAQVVHIRHGLRPDAADLAAARSHAAALGLQFEAIAIVVEPDGSGPESAARAARHDALATAARARGAAAVLLGHTADDQAETMLLNIARGSGLAGLAGMPQVRQLTDGLALIRPVLALRRATVRAVAAASGLPIAQDPTNADPQQRRSRARHQLLPLLGELTGGATDPVVSLARLASHARSDNEALDAIAEAELRRTVATWGPAVAIVARHLHALPEAVGNRVVRRVLAMVSPGHPPSQATVRTLLALRDGQAATLAGGLTASRGGGYLAVMVPCDALPERHLDDGVDLPELGLSLQRRADAGCGVLPPWAPAASAPTVPVAADTPVVVRARRAGDRIRTAAGNQSLADAMIDARVPRVARHLVPVVEDERGVLWVPGVAVRADAAGPLRLQLAPLPGK